jgi:hypothetical protein
MMIIQSYIKRRKKYQKFVYKQTWTLHIKSDLAPAHILKAYTTAQISTVWRHKLVMLCITMLYTV